MSREYSKTGVSRHTLIWLFVAQGISIFPLFFHLPSWLPLVWLFSMGWRVQVYRGAWPYPGFLTRFVLGAVCVTGLFISFAGSLGIESMVAFLVVSFTLKLVELRAKKDVLLVVYIGFIAIAAHFLFYQSFAITVYSICACLLYLAVWNTLYRTQYLPIKIQLLSSARLLLQSMPIMLILFLVLPRLGQLWHVPLQKGAATTGFSDSMSPGDFSSLSRSKAVAFRVTFGAPHLTDEARRAEVAKIPPPSGRYWRALVFDDFDGRKWRYSKGLASHRLSSSHVPPSSWLFDVQKEPDMLEYQVLLEPHNQRWLFTLMAPRQVYSQQLKIGFADDYLTMARDSVMSRTQYHVISHRNYQAAQSGLSKEARRRNLLLPEHFNPKTIALANEWRKEVVFNTALNDRHIVNKALALYREKFTYTLQPPALGSHSVDQFLFGTQRGFCEHFSASFVVLMRAAGVPARVVVGYLGGELNPIDNYLVVRQSDAHAWAEVWLPDEGWRRVDPTSAVSPDRIELGLDEALTDDERALLDSAYSSSPMMARLQQHIEALNYNWQRWVLGYDTARQVNVLERLLGGLQAWRIALFFIGGCGAVIVVYLLWLSITARTRYSSVEQRLYLRFIARFKKRGFERAPGESPRDFAQRIGLEHPAWQAELSLITKLFYAVAYQDQVQQLPALRRHIRKFKW